MRKPVLRQDGDSSGLSNQSFGHLLGLGAIIPVAPVRAISVRCGMLRIFGVFLSVAEFYSLGSTSQDCLATLKQGVI
jgi:hypothetical protein